MLDILAGLISSRYIQFIRPLPDLVLGRWCRISVNFQCSSSHFIYLQSLYLRSRCRQHLRGVSKRSNAIDDSTGEQMMTFFVDAGLAIPMILGAPWRSSANSNGKSRHKPLRRGDIHAVPEHTVGTDSIVFRPTYLSIGGVPAAVSFSGLVPGYLGLYQVIAQIPSNAPAGLAVPVTISLGNATSNQVSIAVAAR